MSDYLYVVDESSAEFKAALLKRCSLVMQHRGANAAVRTERYAGDALRVADNTEVQRAREFAVGLLAVVCGPTTAACSDEAGDAFDALMSAFYLGRALQREGRF